MMASLAFVATLAQILFEKSAARRGAGRSAGLEYFTGVQPLRPLAAPTAGAPVDRALLGRLWRTGPAGFVCASLEIQIQADADAG